MYSFLFNAIFCYTKYVRRVFLRHWKGNNQNISRTMSSLVFYLGLFGWDDQGICIVTYIISWVMRVASLLRQIKTNISPAMDRSYNWNLFCPVL